MNQIKEIQKLFPGKEMIITIDTDICGINNLQQEMNEKMKGKRNQCIVLIDTKQQIFGGIIYNEIKVTNEWIEDENALLFSFNNNPLSEYQFKTYPIQKEESQYAFYLYQFPSDSLFAFGENRDDLYICLQNQFQNHHRKHSFLYHSFSDFLSYPKFQIERCLVLYFI